MIEVVHPGLFTTVQDLGRDGWTHLGISPAGAADAVALRIGNWLTGNAPNTPALEMTLRGGRFRFTCDAVVAVTGSWHSFPVRAGEMLDATNFGHCARAYLCVSGGVATPLTFGSASTHVRSGLGGLDGRALRRGDRLDVNTAVDCAPRSLPERFLPLTRRTRTLRITEGSQAGLFPPDATLRMLASEYAIRADSDRTGLRLAGPPLVCAGGEMLSEGVPWGAIQVPPSGEPILLGVDAQTTGGYPVIGAVITVDLPSLGQLRPGDRIRFQAITIEQAWNLAREQAALLGELESWGV